jgi:hypothetical protein
VVANVDYLVLTCEELLLKEQQACLAVQQSSREDVAKDHLRKQRAVITAGVATGPWGQSHVDIIPDDMTQLTRHRYNMISTSPTLPADCNLFIVILSFIHQHCLA